MQIADLLCQTHLPKGEMRIFLQEITQMSHAQLIARDDTVLNKQQIATLHDWQQRRLNGEPIAYIIGYREFYGRRFQVSPATLIPRPETEHLVEAVLQRLPTHGRVWDLGTGSGAIAITLACERNDAYIRASDISETALAIAQQNAIVHQANIEWAHGSWFNVNMPSENNSFDIIVSNPPYIENGDPHLQQGDLRFEPLSALTDFSDGLACIRVLAEHSQHYLKPQGWLLMEHGYNQKNAVQQILAQYGWQNIETLTDLAGLDRVTIGQAK